MTKKRVVISIQSFKGIVAGAKHYWASLDVVDSPKEVLHFEPFNSKAQARAWVREMWEEHFGDEEYYHEGFGGRELPWMYEREGD